MIILIADDDRLIRFTMKSMLSEILKDYVFLEAANGKDMVEICKKYVPNIVFADIKMPFMDGITAIEKCKEFAPGIEFVVISGYSEFEYAKKCITLGINDYLLKPVEEEQLEKLVMKIQQKCSRQEKESNSRFQLRVFEAFNYFSTLGTEEGYLEFEHADGRKFVTIGFLMDSSRENQKYCIESQKRIILHMQKFSEEFIKKDGYFTSLYSEEGTLYFCFCTAKEGEEKILTESKKIMLRENSGCITFYAVALAADSLREVYQKCTMADSKQCLVMNYPSGTILGEEEFADACEIKDTLSNLYQLLEAWKNVDAVMYNSLLGIICRETGKGLKLSNVRDYCETITGEELSDETFQKFCGALKRIGKDIYQNFRDSKTSMADKVKEYVKKYYMNEISISQIAENFQITPNYLSTIFHQTTNKKFIDYLTEVRLENAKKFLIQNKTASIKDIAVMCGYNSPRYFSELFQKQIGVTPSVYRKNKS